MYVVDLALNNLQWLICHKTKPNYKPRSLMKALLLADQQEFSVNMGCSLKDELGVMDDRGGLREKIRKLPVVSAT